eukprot:Phypoly_transcript_20529.p1 GENE.Phypoly_transcript_20529~~Phypoly_transcript_20529.p1  ORF type:complete len:115 (-),score=32.93 Phypoly_transcript_20529:83-427(-)
MFLFFFLLFSRALGRCRMLLYQAFLEEERRKKKEERRKKKEEEGRRKKKEEERRKKKEKKEEEMCTLDINSATNSSPISSTVTGVRGVEGTREFFRGYFKGNIFISSSQDKPVN